MARDCDQVDVIRLEAVAEDAHAVLACLEPQGGEVQDPIGVGAENRLAIVAALGDVMRYADRHPPRLARHGLGLRDYFINIEIAVTYRPIKV